MEEIIDELNSLLQKINKINEAQINNNKTDINKLKLIGQNYPIKYHILNKADQYMKKIYLHILCSILSFEDNEKKKEKQIIFIQRIISGIGIDVKIEELISSSMCIKDEEIEEFIRVIKDEYCEAFIVDSLICANIDGNKNVKALEFLSEIYSLFDIDEDVFKETIELSAAILEKDDRKILAINYYCNLNKFKGYMNEPIEEHIIYEMSELKECSSKNVLLLNGCFKDINNIINLDKYSFEKIKFVNCIFENIKGIISDKKTLEFIGCQFINNVVENYIESKGIFGSVSVISSIFEATINGNINNGDKSTQNDTLINANLCYIENCVFEKCKVTQSLIKMNGGKIINSSFINCVATKYRGNNFLLNISNAYIENSIFKNCMIENEGADYGNETIDGIIKVTNGHITDCKIENSNCYTQSRYGRFSIHKPYLVYLINSYIEGCEFINCKSDSSYDSDSTYKYCMISLNKSTESNNKFLNCKCNNNVIEE